MASGFFWFRHHEYETIGMLGDGDAIAWYIDRGHAFT